MPIFRRFLAILPFLAGPIFGATPINPISGQLYLYNAALLIVLFASWSVLLQLFGERLLSQPDRQAAKKSKSSFAVTLVIGVLLLFFVLASLTLLRNSILPELFKLTLLLLAMAAVHRRAVILSPDDVALFTGFLYGFGIATLSLWLGFADEAFDWIIVVPAMSIASLSTFYRVASVVEREGLRYFNSESKPGGKKQKQAITNIHPAQHPRHFARAYTAMLLLGPASIAMLAGLDILPPTYLLPIIAVPIMTSNFQGIHSAKHLGSFPQELERKSTNFSILLVILVIVAGIF